MEMQQMMEFLLAEVYEDREEGKAQKKANREERKAERKANQEEILAKMDTNLVRRMSF
jgi:hypothetical protein